MSSRRQVSIRLLGRAGLRYSEGERSVFVDSEFLTGGSGLVVYGNSIREWTGPGGPELVSEAERERILQDIVEEFRSGGVDIQIA